jgi:hypothetical protein
LHNAPIFNRLEGEMHTDTAGITATELQGEEGKAAYAAVLAGDLTLARIDETEEQRKYRLLGSPYVLSLKNAAERRCVEAERIKADLAYNRLKNSGELRRREIDRAHRAEVEAGLHS